MREMKDSGVEWIGEVPADWFFVRIGSLYQVRMQKVSDKEAPPLSVTKRGIVPQLEAVAKTDAHDDRKLVKKGDFVINSRSDRRGSCGISGYEGSVSLINTVLSPRGDMNPVYHNWLFHTIRFADEFYKWGNGIVDDLWTTRWGDMQNIVIPQPPPPEQHRIADFLDTQCAAIDDARSDTEREIALLKEYKQALITQAVTKGLDPDAEMKDSGVEWIGEMPEHWLVGRVKHIADPSRAYAVGDGDHGLIGPDDYSDRGVPYLRVLNLTWGSGLSLDNLVYISEEMNSKIKNSELCPGDLLIAKTGATIGKTAIVPSRFPRSNTTSHVGKITVSPAHDSRFFFYVLTSSVVQNQIQELSAMQSTRPELGIEGLKNLQLPIAPLDDQHRIADFLDTKCTAIDDQIADLEAELTTLEDYKKSLIFDYVTGKKEVPADAC